MRDLYHNVLATQVLNPAVTTSTQTSATIDLQGFDSANIIFAIGTSADTLTGSLYWTLSLQHSDTDSSYAAIAATDSSAGVASIAVNSMSLDDAAYAIGYIGGKRYVQAVVTATGSHSSGTPIGIVALRGTPAYRPVV